MKHLILVAAVAMGMATTSVAGELDNEASVTNQAMNGTVVIRVDTRNNEASVLTYDKVVANESEAQFLAQAGSFSPVPSENVKSELDQDGAASSWYFYTPYTSYYYAYMYCYGTWYTPRYTYTYSYYRYYYYSRFWW